MIIVYSVLVIGVTVQVGYTTIGGYWLIFYYHYLRKSWTIQGDKIFLMHNSPR